jgi:hypothetical protein
LRPLQALAWSHREKQKLGASAIVLARRSFNVTRTSFTLDIRHECIQVLSKLCSHMQAWAHTAAAPFRSVVNVVASHRCTVSR